jgi:cation diffusion facilitator CzcD-associated flavoprotein CzcO
VESASHPDGGDGARAGARRIAVVGGGFGGVAAAVMLRRAGHRDVTVFERGERVGGVWHHNTYP